MGRYRTPICIHMILIYQNFLPITYCIHSTTMKITIHLNVDTIAMFNANKIILFNWLVTTTYTMFLARTASFLTKIMLVFTRNNCRCCVHENQPLMMLILLFWITLNLLVLVYIVFFTVFRKALQCIVISFFP